MRYCLETRTSRHTLRAMKTQLVASLILPTDMTSCQTAHKNLRSRHIHNICIISHLCTSIVGKCYYLSAHFQDKCLVTLSLRMLGLLFRWLGLKSLYCNKYCHKCHFNLSLIKCHHINLEKGGWRKDACNS